jgi:hypothetical protein
MTPRDLDAIARARRRRDLWRELWRGGDGAGVDRAVPGHVGSAHPTGSATGDSSRSMDTPSSPSVSMSWTFTVSSREVGTFLPT